MNKKPIKFDPGGGATVTVPEGYRVVGLPKPKAISVAYDTHNMRLVALCDDGSLWARFSERDEEGAVKWRWVKLEDFNPE